MPRTRNTGLCAGLVVALALAAPAAAQWSASTTSPLIVGEVSSDIPTLRATADGGAFAVWQQTGGGFYNGIRIQRLSPTGVKLWGDAGLVAVPGTDTATFVGDFDCCVAADGNLIVSSSTQFPDPANPTVRQSMVQKFNAATGAKMWGTGGADVWVSTAQSNFGGWPAYVCPMPDGGCVVAYNVTVSSTVQAIRLMRVTPSGALAWPSPRTVLLQNNKIVPTSIQAAGASPTDESFILLYSVTLGLNQAGLRVQKFDGQGVAVAGWGATPADALVLDAAGITPRDFPRVLPDGQGGAIIGWRTYANPGFGACADAVIQHVLPSGAFKFPVPIAAVAHAGAGSVPCGGQGGQGVFTASAGFLRDALSGQFSYFIAGAQGPSSNGTVRSVIAQKFDDAGNRLWGPGGYYVVQQSSNTQIGPNHVTLLTTSEGGAIVTGYIGRGFTTINAVNFVTKINPQGFADWDRYYDTDATTGKGRIAAVSPAGTSDAIILWNRGSRLAATRISASSGAPGVVPTPPSIDTDLPGVVQACEGATVVLSVEVSGTPNLSYRWQRRIATPNSNPDPFVFIDDGAAGSTNCLIPTDGTTYGGVYTPTLTIRNARPIVPTAACPNLDPSLNQYRVVVFNAASDGVNNTSSAISNVVSLDFSGACGGVCCRGSVCSIEASAAACVPSGVAGSAFNPGSACNATGNATAPCCKADYNKRGGVELLDIFAFLEDWFNGNPLTDYNANGQANDLLDIFGFLEGWFTGGC